jgi:hypothetical protein
MPDFAHSRAFMCIRVRGPVVGGGDERNKSAFVASVMLGPWALASRAASVTPDDAANHAGQNATVCAVVALTNVDTDSRFSPTFLDFGKPYPDQGPRRAIRPGFRCRP